MKLRTILIGVGVLALLLVVRSFGGGYEVTNYPTAGTTIVAFGDSLVAGMGTTAGGDFVSLLGERLGQPVLNLGVAGDTTADGLARLDAVLEADPRVVILLLGGNDALRRMEPSVTFRNLDTIITTLQESGAAILLLGVPGGLQNAVYKKEFPALAERHGVAFVPNILEDIIGTSALMDDPIHPNNSGHMLMADRIEPLVRDLLAGAR